MSSKSQRTLYHRLGQQYWQQGLYARAQDCYHYLSELAPDQKAHWLYWQGLCHRQLRQWPEALDCFRQSQMLQPLSDPWLYAEMAEALQQLKKHTAAKRYWWAAIQLTPEPWFYDQLIALFTKEGQLLKALQVAEQALEDIPGQPDPALYVRLCHLYLHQLQLSKAAKCFYEARKLSDTRVFPPLLRRISKILVRKLSPAQRHCFTALMYTATPETAIQELTFALEIEPQWWDLYFYRAWYYRGLGQLELALADLNIFLEHYPDSLNARSERGVLYCRMDELEKGIADLAFVFRYKPQDTVVGIPLFYAYREQRYFEDAQNLLDQLKQAEHQDYPLDSMQNHLDIATGRIKAVLRRLRYSEDLNQLMEKAKLYALMGETEPLKWTCFEIVERSHQHPEWALNVMDLLIQSGQIEDAATVFEQLEAWPEQPPYCKIMASLLSWIAFYQGDLDAAWEMLQQSFEYGVSKPGDYMQLGYIYSWMGDYISASEAFEQVCQTSAGPETQLNLALCAFNQGDYGLARERLENLADESCEWIQSYVKQPCLN